MSLTPHQKTVIELCKANNNQITKKQVCEVITFQHNTEYHVGEILSRMVRKNLIVRVKSGVYKLSIALTEVNTQSNLF